VLADEARHVLCWQPIPKIPWGPAHREPHTPLTVGVVLDDPTLLIIEWRTDVNPVGRILRVSLLLETNANGHSFTLVRTDLDFVWKGDDLATRAFEDRGLVA